MAEPLWMNLTNMDVSLNQKPDGNVMTTMAGTGIVTKGRNMEGMDGLGAGRRGPSSSSVLPSSSSLSSSGSVSAVSAGALFLSSSALGDIVGWAKRIDRICGGPGCLLGGSYETVKSLVTMIKDSTTEMVTEMAIQLNKAEEENARLEQQIRRTEMERKEIERKETKRKETEREELERKENERRETERKEMERKEMEKKELVTQLQEAKGEIARLEGVIRRMSAEKKEIERRESVRMEMERKETERKETERKETERKETERKETNRKERERKELERKESERMEMKRKEMERKETVKKEMERKEYKRKEMERQETERKEMERKKMEKKKAGPIMSEGYNIMSISPFLIGEDFPLHPLLQRVTRKSIARSGGDRMPPVGQSPPPVINRGFEGAKTDGEACNDVILEDGIMSGSETEWRLVGGRRRGKDPLPLPPLPLTRKDSSGVMRNANMDVVNCRVERRSPSWQQPRNRPRPPSFSVVSIVGRTEGFSCAEALKSARRSIDLETLGIRKTHIRKTANGELFIKILEEDSRAKAEELGIRIREVLGDSAIVSCPSGKKREVRVTGFDETVSVEEIVGVCSISGGCSSTEVWVGPIRTLNNGMGMARVQLPAAAAAKLVDTECVRLGWTMARVELVEIRPLQCYRCWKYGHVRSMCRSLMDRRDACYKCGQSGHMAGSCHNAPHCVICHDAGLEAVHRLGGPHCRAQVQQQDT